MAVEPPAALDVVDYIAQTRESYDALGYEPYRWAENPEPAELVRPSKPLSESRVVLIASGGIYRSGQVAFHHRDDTSYRRIPADVAIEDLRTSHFAYDLTDARADPNAVFPIDALRRLAAEGTIAEVASHALTFMGGIYSQRRLREELIPALEAGVRDLRADVVLLVPV